MKHERKFHQSTMNSQLFHFILACKKEKQPINAENGWPKIRFKSVDRILDPPLPPPPSTNSYFTEEMIPINLNN